MPAYSFNCQKCQNSFCLEVSFEEYDKKDKKKFRCPKCGSTKIRQAFGNVFFIKNKGNKNPIHCACGN